MHETTFDRVASAFVINAICEFGQPESVRIAAVQGVLDAAGFAATATGFPVFGGIWTKPCEGKDGHEASAWLRNLTDTMQRGKFELEVVHVVTCLTERQEVRS